MTLVVLLLVFACAMLFFALLWLRKIHTKVERSTEAIMTYIRMASRGPIDPPSP